MMHYFLDPIYQSSLFGTMLMALSCSLLGVFIFLEKRSLIVETLAHAAYPGVALGLIFGALKLPGAIALGGLFTVFLAFRMVGRLQRDSRVAPDPALCFTMAAFLGVGALLASYLQGTSPVLAKKMDTYLFGQAATMLSGHMIAYAILAAATLVWVGFHFHALKARAFDRSFARLEGVRLWTLDAGMLLLVALSIVFGTRCVGVVLMAGMLIAPAVAARQWTRSLGPLLILSASIGVFGAMFGNIIAFKQQWVSGPVIVCVTGLVAFASLLIVYFKRLFRKMRFRMKCLKENLLKFLWKRGGCSAKEELSHCFPSMILTPYALWRLRRAGWLNRHNCLTDAGMQRGEQIVRLHRLWELYLSSNLGFLVQDVHPSAEQMEHILTPELERELTKVLGNPGSDPHAQPIPGGAL